VRDFLGFPGATTEAHGLTNQLSHVIFARSVSYQALNQMLDARCLRFVERDRS